MGSDDAVESFERHAGDEEGGAQDSTQCDGDDDCAVVELSRRHVHPVHHVQVTRQSCQDYTY